MSARIDDDNVVESAAVRDGGSRSHTGQEGCEHGWRTESRHPTSTGTVLYVRCVRCGVRRVDVQPYAAEPPVAVSIVIAPDA